MGINVNNFYSALLIQAKLLKHCHSGDVKPMRKVVGYASVALEF